MYSFCSRSFFLSKGNSLGLKELFRMQLPFSVYLFSASCLCRARVPKAHTPHFPSLFLLGLVLASFARPVSALSQKALIQVRNGRVLFLALCSVSHGTAVFFTSLNVPSLAYLMVCTCSAEPYWYRNEDAIHTFLFDLKLPFWHPMETSFLGRCLHWGMECIPPLYPWVTPERVMFSLQVNEALRRISW